MGRKLDILVPVYNESSKTIKPLLDSISIQQNVDMNEIGVIICNDGGTFNLNNSDVDIKKYPFEIEYHECKHKGVSATRNSCLDKSLADYVMFCDADDMFYNACGLYIVFQEIDNEGFDTLSSIFIEETRHPETKKPIYITREMDSTFVHGKVHNRKFLINNNIRWNDNLTIHEDSYFNCLCQRLAKDFKYCQAPFYLWKWRDESVCRHDEKYILKTYNNMLDSNTALVNEFLDRRRKEDAQYFATSMIFDAYYTLCKDEWWADENSDYKRSVELRFKKYYEDFKYLFESIPNEIKNQIIVGIRNRMFGEGLMLEKITFEDWIKHITSLED